MGDSDRKVERVRKRETERESGHVFDAQAGTKKCTEVGRNKGRQTQIERKRRPTVP